MSYPVFNSMSRNGSNLGKNYKLFDLTNGLGFTITNFSLDMSYNTTQFSSNPSVVNTGGELSIKVSDTRLSKYLLSWSKDIFDPKSGRQGLKKDYVRDLFLLSDKFEESALLNNSFITSFAFDGEQEVFIKADYVNLSSFPDSNLDESFLKAKQIIRSEKIDKLFTIYKT